MSRSLTPPAHQIPLRAARPVAVGQQRRVGLCDCDETGQWGLGSCFRVVRALRSARPASLVEGNRTRPDAIRCSPGHLRPVSLLAQLVPFWLCPGDGLRAPRLHEPFLGWDLRSGLQLQQRDSVLRAASGSGARGPVDHAAIAAQRSHAHRGRERDVHLSFRQVLQLGRRLVVGPALFDADRAAADDAGCACGRHRTRVAIRGGRPVHRRSTAERRGCARGRRRVPHRDHECRSDGPNRLRSGRQRGRPEPDGEHAGSAGLRLARILGNRRKALAGARGLGRLRLRRGHRQVRVPHQPTGKEWPILFTAMDETLPANSSATALWQPSDQPVDCELDSPIVHSEHSSPDHARQPSKSE